MKINFPSTFQIISSKLTISKKFSVLAFLETNDEPDKNTTRRSNLEERLGICNRLFYFGIWIKAVNAAFKVVDNRVLKNKVIKIPDVFKGPAAIHVILLIDYQSYLKKKYNFYSIK